MDKEICLKMFNDRSSDVDNYVTWIIHGEDEEALETMHQLYNIAPEEMRRIIQEQGAKIAARKESRMRAKAQKQQQQKAQQEKEAAEKLASEEKAQKEAKRTAKQEAAKKRQRETIERVRASWLAYEHRNDRMVGRFFTYPTEDPWGQKRKWYA